MSEQQENKPKKDIFGFTKIGEDQYQSDVDPNIVMTAREFNSSLACALALLFGVVGMVGGCTSCVCDRVQHNRTKDVPAARVVQPVNTAYQQAVQNQYRITQFHKQK